MSEKENHNKSLDNLEENLDDILLDDNLDEQNNLSAPKTQALDYNKYINDFSSFIQKNIVNVSIVVAIIICAPLILNSSTKNNNANNFNDDVISNIDTIDSNTDFIIESSVVVDDNLVHSDIVDDNSRLAIDEENEYHANTKNNMDIMDDSVLIEDDISESNKWNKIENNLFKEGQKIDSFAEDLSLITSYMQELKEENKVLLDKILEIEQQNTNLLKSINVLQKNITSIDNKSDEAIVSIQKIDRELSKQLATFEGLEDIRESFASRELKLSQPDLSIHAIIHGRAWLRTTNGEIITVNEGDVIEKYGKVLKINPQMGTITTSSGTTLSR